MIVVLGCHLTGATAVAAVAEAATTDTSDACGSRPAKADGTRWSCTLVDDFGGSRLDRSLWLPRTGPSQKDSYMVDGPSTVQVADGQLHLTAHPTRTPVTCGGQTSSIVTGQVSTYRTFSQRYGRFEVRMRVTDADVPGLQEAFWLWPDDRFDDGAAWPAAGEIDVVESYSQYRTLAIPFLHYTSNDNGGPVPGTNTAWDCKAPRGQWHTYTLTWTADQIRIQVDDELCLVNRSGDQAFDQRYIVALSQLLGVAGNGYTIATPLPATTDVDYVKVWR